MTRHNWIKQLHYSTSYCQQSNKQGFEFSTDSNLNERGTNDLVFGNLMASFLCVMEAKRQPHQGDMSNWQATLSTKLCFNNSQMYLLELSLPNRVDCRSHIVCGALMALTTITPEGAIILGYITTTTSTTFTTVWQSFNWDETTVTFWIKFKLPPQYVCWGEI